MRIILSGIEFFSYMTRKKFPNLQLKKEKTNEHNNNNNNTEVYYETRVR